MNRSELRAWYFSRQGLDGGMAGRSAQEILSRTGWARSVGGVNPYLTLFSRGGISREVADRELAALEIAELPTARGCTYVLPREDFEIGLVLGTEFNVQGDRKTAKQFGVTDDEIEGLAKQILACLGEERLDPAAMKLKLGDAVRNLGTEAKKKGLTTTLPMTLSYLQSLGLIVRIAANGRFDTQKYLYKKWRSKPLESTSEAVAWARRETVRKYIEWAAPCTISELSWFTGLSQKTLKPYVDELQTVEIEPGRFLLKRDLAAFESFVAPTNPQVRFVAGLDGLFLLRRDAGVFLDSQDLERLATVEGKSSTGSLAEINYGVVLDRGRIIGLWEFDSFAGRVVCGLLSEAPAGFAAELEMMDAFCREQLGDARSFSLDSPESRKEKIGRIRQLAVAV